MVKSSNRVDNHFLSIFVQPSLLTRSSNSLLSFQGGFSYDVYFRFLLESHDLNIIKALNKMDFANRVD